MHVAHARLHARRLPSIFLGFARQSTICAQFVKHAQMEILKPAAALVLSTVYVFRVPRDVNRLLYNLLDGVDLIKIGFAKFLLLLTSLPKTQILILSLSDILRWGLRSMQPNLKQLSQHTCLMHHRK